MCKDKVNKKKNPSKSMNRNFSNAIENWYKEYKRELPWRDLGRSVCNMDIGNHSSANACGAGYDYFVRFMKRFPDVATLAEADEDEVMKYWQGLGLLFACP